MGEGSCGGGGEEFSEKRRFSLTALTPLLQLVEEDPMSRTRNLQGAVATALLCHASSASAEAYLPWNTPAENTGWPPTGGYNRDCTKFRTPAATFGGVARENDVRDNCRMEEGTYFFGDLVAQTLWDIRAGAPDAEQWEKVAIRAALLTNDCALPDVDPQDWIDDCPDLFSEYFIEVEHHALELMGPSFAQQVEAVLYARGLL